MHRASKTLDAVHAASVVRPLAQVAFAAGMAVAAAVGDPLAPRRDGGLGKPPACDYCSGLVDSFVIHKLPLIGRIVRACTTGACPENQ